METRGIKKYFENCTVEVTCTEHYNSYKGRYFANAMYLHFRKDLFPKTVYPALIRDDFGRPHYEYGKLMVYIEGHSYLSRYSERTEMPSNTTLVVLGWDFLHLGDEMYEARDCVELIFKKYADSLSSQLDKEIERIGAK